MSASEIEHGLTPTWTVRRLGRLLGRADTNAYALVSTTEDRPDPVAGTSPALERCAGLSIAAFGSEHAHLILHAVAPFLRRAGYGRRLIEWQIRAAITAGITGLSLELRAENEPAFAFYRKFGFVVIGRRAGYYQEREDAIRMRLSPLASQDCWQSSERRL